MFILHGEEAHLRRLRTMLRIAGRTMRPQSGFILRDAAKSPLLRMRSSVSFRLAFQPLMG
jgi:hypothetical protein